MKWFCVIFLALFTFILVGSSYQSNKVTQSDTKQACLGARAILRLDQCDNPYGKVNLDYTKLAMSDNYLALINKKGQLCYNAFDEFRSDQSKFCTVGDKYAKKSIILFGDSHAQQYINTFDQIGRNQGYRVLLYDYTGCVSDTYANSSSCGKRLAAIAKSQKEFQESSLVVMSLMYHNSYRFMKRNIEFVQSITPTPIVLMEDNAHTTPQRLYACYLLQTKCELNKGTATVNIPRITERIKRDKLLSNGRIINTSDFYCHGSKCYSSIGDIPVYYNTSAGKNINSHITATYAYTLAPLVEYRLQKAGVL